MNNHKLNIDEYTKKLVQKGEVMEPGVDFTKKVMGQILKNPDIQLSFVKDDDKKSNVWLFVSLAVMFVAYIVYYIIKHGISTITNPEELKLPLFVKAFIDFFSGLFSELSLSPFILLALVGVVLLIIMDKTIVKYLYSI